METLSDLEWMTHVLAVRETGVFWDVDDWSTPNFEDPCLIDHNVELTLQEEGYRGSVSIWAYGDEKEKMSDLMKRRYGEYGFLVSNDGDKCERAHNMIIDVLNWGRSQNRPANLVVLSDIKEDTDLLYLLKELKRRGHNVMVALKSEEDSPPLLQSATEIKKWVCPTILDRREYRI